MTGLSHKWIAGALCAAVSAVAASAVWGASAAGAAPLPNKFLLASRIGWEVDKTTSGEKVCTVSSGDGCQAAVASGEPGGFQYPEGVAAASDGHVYVADGAENHRVDELDENGAFVLMFGWNVNRTKVQEAGASQAEKNVCTAASGDACQAGEEGSGLAGQIAAAQDVAVDPNTGSVYVFDPANHRIDEYTANGEFLLMIGGEVNATKDATAGASEAEKNLCTAASGDTCQGGVESPEGSKIEGAFKPVGSAGNLLAVDSNDVLYVGDEHRIQKFGESGEWKGEVDLTPISAEAGRRVMALAVDESTNLYVVYAAPFSEGSDVVRKLDSSGAQLEEFTVAPGEPSTVIVGMALDPHGRLGLIVKDNRPPFTHGLIYDTSGERISQLSPVLPEASFAQSLAFTPADKLFLDGIGTHEVEAYEPVVFAEVRDCAPEEVTPTSAKLCADINPNGVHVTSLFEYAPPAGALTSTAFEGEGLGFAPVRFALTGLEPNQTYRYDALAEGSVGGVTVRENGEASEFRTPTTPPLVVGVPSASFITDQTATLSASLNPEHAITGYYFEYGACAKLSECAAVLKTPLQSSSQYGTIGTTQEVTGLAASTTYSFRLAAEGEGGSVTGPESTFATGSAPVLAASTGTATVSGPATATITGTVDPDGHPGVYVFEVGLYQGAMTHFAVVATGSTGTVPVGESAALSDLMPGASYAYRIAIRSGYGNATGGAETFTTPNTSSTLEEPGILQLLPSPAVKFPKPARAASCRRGKGNRCARTRRRSRRHGTRRHRRKRSH
jgi:hypothetical protein